ncbi:MAG: type II toxin-antitoxin system VapC family toxin [Nitrospiria bacterium]
MALPLGKKILLDTNIFVDYLRNDLHADWVFGRSDISLRFLSSVVIMELRLGADTLRRKRAVDKIISAFPSERMVAPSTPMFDQAGELFRRIHGFGDGMKDRLGPMNDLLIALTARYIGGVLITKNLQDFQRIVKYLPGLALHSPDWEKM